MAGLFAALLLRRAGWRVDVYERIGAELAGRGAGIVTHRELFDVLAKAGIDTAAAALGVTQDGFVIEATYAAGDTRHFVYGAGEYKIHDLENVGDTDLWFTTVEFVVSANEPLEINAITDPR